MPLVVKSVLVSHSVQTMFDLVDDVEHYPDFLPWCGGARAIERDATKTVATIDIRYAGVKQSFTTENTKQRPEWMKIELRDGPFRKLQGCWTFTRLADEASKVELQLEYSFANGLLEAAVGPVFGMIADTMIDRFVNRADALASAGKDRLG
jgi:ribosome-associated toxin RatA of RatAB toxin-antitoxin module